MLIALDDKSPSICFSMTDKFKFICVLAENILAIDSVRK